jgi:hypothetical protein
MVENIYGAILSWKAQLVADGQQNARKGRKKAA